MAENLEKLSEDEIAYQNYILSKYQELALARKFWQEHLASKYSLKETDGVTTDGYIKRGVSNSEQPAPSQVQPDVS